MYNNDFRLKLIFLALCILILLAIKDHVKLGYAPEPERKSIAVTFNYYGAFEKEVETLVSRLEEAYMEVRGIRCVESESEEGRGYILCQFSDQAVLDDAYVQISDITAYVWSSFPEGASRPTITRSSRDSYPVYIAYYPQEKGEDADLIKKAYEAVPGVGAVELGGQRKKELMVELHTGRLAGMALPSQKLGSLLRRSNLARKVAMPGGQTLVLSSRLSASEFGRVHVSPELRLSDVADLEYKEASHQSLGHIDGESVLLFFVMKSGEGNIVRLCRELDLLTAHFGGSQFFSLGNKIEKSFIVTSVILLLLFILLNLGVWYKTRSFLLMAHLTCFAIGSPLAAIFAVSIAGFQVDMTVMAALFLVVCLTFNFHTLALSLVSALIIALYMPEPIKALILPFCIALASGLCAASVCRHFFKHLSLPRYRIPVWCYSPLLLFAIVLLPFTSFPPVSSDVSFSLEYESGTSPSFIQKSALDIESELLKWSAFERLTMYAGQDRASFTIIGGKKGDIMAKINELSSRWPEIFFYIPEKHTRHAVNVFVYGNDVPEIKNNVLQLAKYVNDSTNNVKIIYHFKSDVQNIVLEIPIKCIKSGIYPYDVYRHLYYTVAEPVVDKFFDREVETDVKLRGDIRYRGSLEGLLSMPVLTDDGIMEAKDLITVRRIPAQGRICHRNRMRCLSLSVTGISRKKLRKLVSEFQFSGSCHGEVL